MALHLYQCGQHVTLVGKRNLGPGWNGDFVIIRQLPSGDEAPRYEIKSAREVYSRVASEDQLATSLTIFR